MLPGIPPRREQIGIQGWGIRIDASRRRFRAIALRFLLAERAFLDDDQRFACATPAARTRTVRLSSHADILQILVISSISFTFISHRLDERLTNYMNVINLFFMLFIKNLSKTLNFFLNFRIFYIDILGN